jgi:hypothetical protein
LEGCKLSKRNHSPEELIQFCGDVGKNDVNLDTMLTIKTCDTVYRRLNSTAHAVSFIEKQRVAEE